jgi:hypothetical protein
VLAFLSMLLLQQSPRRASILRSFIMVAAAAMAVAGSGCASVVGVQDVVVDFLVKPQGDGSFWGWSEITTTQDTSAANRATLLAVTLDVERPEGTPDLTFLETMKGEAVAGAQRTLIATAQSFPRGEQAVTMQVKYLDDLRPLFKDPHTFRMEWTGQTNTAFTAWPADGFWVRGRVKVEIQ